MMMARALAIKIQLVTNADVLYAQQHEVSATRSPVRTSERPKLCENKADWGDDTNDKIVSSADAIQSGTDSLPLTFSQYWLIDVGSTADKLNLMGMMFDSISVHCGPSLRSASSDGCSLKVTAYSSIAAISARGRWELQVDNPISWARYGLQPL